jgi:glycosyltransferase involved in cell wall biosynthesis
MAENIPASAAMPLVSVLIPAFNHEDYVVRCLDSVLDDPYPSKEIVIIDDGSADQTAERIEAWAERHRDEIAIEFVRRENKGIAATLNELAARARGEFLRIGASDDYLLPGGCEVLVRYLMMHPEKSAAIGDCIVVDRYGSKILESGMSDLHHADKRLYRSDEGIRRAVISHWAVGGPVTMLRKNALDTVARWTEGLRVDDWDLFLRLAARDAIGFIDIKVCAYRLHGENFSKTRHTATRIVNLTEARQVALRRLCMFGEPDRTRLRAEAYHIGAKIAFLQGRTWLVALQMAAYLTLLAVSKIRPVPQRQRVGET